MSPCMCVHSAVNFNVLSKDIIIANDHHISETHEPQPQGNVWYNKKFKV